MDIRNWSNMTANIWRQFTFILKNTNFQIFDEEINVSPSTATLKLPETYLRLFQTSVMELFSENS